MCFSAKASFIASSLLAIAGTLTLKQVKDKSQIIFASMPILFSIQQFCEAIIWLVNDKFDDTSYLMKFFSYIFLTFALIIWPIVIPLSLMKLEKNLEVKKYLKIILSLGISWSSLFVFILFTEKVTIDTNCSNIYYSVQMPFYFNYNIALIIYCLTTILPFFISKQKVMKLFGILLLISCLVSYFYWNTFLTSVWCYFAALLSISVYAIIRWQNLREEYIKVLSKHL